MDAGQARGQRGFTLVELVIVMVVASILAAIAVPAYTDHVRRGRASAAASQLKDLRARMEQRYADERAYAVGAAAACYLPGFVDEQIHFGFACALTAAGQGFTWTATGRGPMAGFGYTIDEAGLERTTQALPWGVTGAVDRFVLRKGG